MRIEIRSDSVVLDGYVNVCARESRVLPSPRGKFVEEIKPKTFERALMKNDSVDLLFNHDRNRKLGSTKEGNLELREDNVGLRAIATITDEEVIEKAKKQELRGWSFGFSVIKDEWNKREDGIYKRSVEELELYEVSVLDRTPAYVATSIEARAGEESILTETRAEEFEAKVEVKADETNPADKSKEEEDNKKKDEKREIPDSTYFKTLEQEITLMQLQGGFLDK